MKWYQPIECSNTVKKPLICDLSNLEEFGYHEDDFKSGSIIAQWSDSVYMKASLKKYDGDPDDVLQNVYMIPVFSQIIKEALDGEGVCGMQLLPIKIFDINSTFRGVFFIANITNFTDAFDYANSEYNRFDANFPNPNVRGSIAGVTKFVLLKDKLNGLDVIRLKDYNQRFFFSERIVNLFEGHGFTGYSFKEVVTI